MTNLGANWPYGHGKNPGGSIEQQHQARWALTTQSPSDGPGWSWVLMRETSESPLGIHANAIGQPHSAYWAPALNPVRYKESVQVSPWSKYIKAIGHLTPGPVASERQCHLTRTGDLVLVRWLVSTSATTATCHTKTTTTTTTTTTTINKLHTELRANAFRKEKQRNTNIEKH